MKKLIKIILILIVLESALYSQLADSPSPKFRINIKNTGVSAYGPTPTIPMKAIKVITNWKAETGSNVWASPSIGNDGKIYVGSCDKYMYCFNSDGSNIWRSLTGDVIHSSAAIGNNNKVYVGSFDNYLYCFFTNGKTNRRYKTGGAICSSPSIGSNGNIYVGSHDHYLYCFNTNGTTNWKSATTNDIGASIPAIGNDGRIYIGSLDNYLYCFDPDGSTNWYRPTGDGINSSPAIGNDGNIYVGSKDSYLYCFSTNGNTNRKVKTGGIISISCPAIGNDGRIYIGSYDNYLYCFNPDGTINWQTFLGGIIRSSPVIGSDNKIYIGSHDSYLYCLNPDGTINWKVKTGGSIDSSPVIGSNGEIYIGSSDHYLYCFKVLSCDTGQVAFFNKAPGQYFGVLNLKLTAYKDASKKQLDPLVTIIATIYRNDILYQSLTGNGSIDITLPAEAKYKIKYYTKDNFNNINEIKEAEYIVLIEPGRYIAVYPTVINLNEKDKVIFAYKEQKNNVDIKICTLRGNVVKTITGADFSTGLYEYKTENFQSLPAGRYILKIKDKKALFFIIK